MIGQYLSNTNKRATVSILQNILELNKAWGYNGCRTYAVSQQHSGIQSSTQESQRAPLEPRRYRWTWTASVFFFTPSTHVQYLRLLAAELTVLRIAEEKILLMPWCEQVVGSFIGPMWMYTVHVTFILPAADRRGEETPGNRHDMKNASVTPSSRVQDPSKGWTRYHFTSCLV